MDIIKRIFQNMGDKNIRTKLPGDICRPVMCLMEYNSSKTQIGTKFQGLSACFNELKMKVETVCPGFQF